LSDIPIIHLCNRNLSGGRFSTGADSNLQIGLIVRHKILPKGQVPGGIVFQLFYLLISAPLNMLYGWKENNKENGVQKKWFEKVVEACKRNQQFPGFGK
jgi:hypothetical protein